MEEASGVSHICLTSKNCSKIRIELAIKIDDGWWSRNILLYNAIVAPMAAAADSLATAGVNSGVTTVSNVSVSGLIGMNSTPETVTAGVNASSLSNLKDRIFLPVHCMTTCAVNIGS